MENNMNLFKFNTDNNSFILTYEKNKPELFIESVNQYVEHVKLNPDYFMDSNDCILFCDEAGELICENFREIKAVAIEIGGNPTFQTAFVLLCRTLVNQMKKQVYNKRYLFEEFTQGEDLMFGLIEMGRGEHFYIIEEWVGLVDWHFACEQADVVYGPKSQWGTCIESYRICAYALVFNSEQWAYGHLESQLKRCNSEELELFFKAVHLVKDKIYDQDKTISLNELLECILSIQSGTDHSIDSPEGLLTFKLVVSMMDSKKMLRDYFLYYICNVWSWIEKDLNDIENEFDWWIQELETNSHELVEEMQKLKIMFLQVKGIVENDLTPEENFEKIEAFSKKENIDDIIIRCYKKLLK